jgi:hypothetical protein
MKRALRGVAASAHEQLERLVHAAEVERVDGKRLRVIHCRTSGVMAFTHRLHR